MVDSSINKQEASFGAVNNVEHSLKSTQKNTKLCRFVSRKSGCNKGDQCNFYHPPRHEKPSTRKKTADTNPGQKMNKIPIECRFFNSPRGCRNFLNGRECRFEHVTKPGNNKQDYSHNHNQQHKNNTHPSKTLSNKQNKNKNAMSIAPAKPQLQRQESLIQEFLRNTQAPTKSTVQFQSLENSDQQQNSVNLYLFHPPQQYQPLPLPQLLQQQPLQQFQQQQPQQSMEQLQQKQPQ